MSIDQRSYPDEVREIHALSPSPSLSPSPLPPPPPPPVRGRLGELWDSSSRSSTLSSSEVENFASMSREFNALVVAGTTVDSDATDNNSEAAANLRRIREEEPLEETNPLAIVPDTNPIASPRPSSMGPSSSSVDRGSGSAAAAAGMEEVSVHRVKKEEVESKIGAWQTAEIAKINNRFKREDVIINGWEKEQIEKAAAVLKKIERKIEEKRARAIEKMQNDVARARQKAEEKRASAEAKRGTKVAKILELSTLLRAVGRAPSKRSIF